MDDAARRIAELVDDGMPASRSSSANPGAAQGASSASAAAPTQAPTSQLWGTPRGSLRYERGGVGDETVDGVYWPIERWTYASSRLWPNGTEAQRNATLVSRFAAALGVPASSLGSRVIPEPWENETEFHILLPVGDLGSLRVAALKVGQKAGMSLTRLELTQWGRGLATPTTGLDGRSLLSNATLAGLATEAARCWVASTGHAANVSALRQADIQVRFLNATLVVSYGFETPTALNKPGCWNDSILAVLMDPVSGSLRGVRMSHTYDACLSSA